MNLRKAICEKRIYLDGGFGTMLQKNGLLPGERAEEWNITHPDVVTDIHLRYINAGSNIINANTFGANIYNYTAGELEKIISSAIKNARRAIEMSGREVCLALDIGPTGKMLKPLGDLDFESSVDVFKKTIEIALKYGVDLINIETMTDSYEAKAAIIAAKETDKSGLPIFVCNAYDEKGMTSGGNSIESNVAMYEGLGVDALGLNCSLGPDLMLENCRRLLKCSSLPIIIKPNAGLPVSENGETKYDMDASEFADYMEKIALEGATILGGCCGTTPEYIEKLVESTEKKPFKKNSEKNLSVVSSRSKVVYFGEHNADGYSEPKIIGERINPTGKKRLKEALKSGDLDYCLDLAFEQQEKNAHVLDVNVGTPGIDEPAVLKSVTELIQSCIDIPLQLDSADDRALEAAMRIYNGKPMVNSVSGKKNVMEKVFPLVKKYGGFVVALTLDENGIPDDPDERIAIAEKILETAAEYGLKKKDIIFDALTMTVSTDKLAAKKTLKCVKRIHDELGCNTCLGVSNVSFGLPDRQKINAAFFTLAMENGLSAGIVNPSSDEMMNAYYSFKALNGCDENFEEYISHATAQSQNSEVVSKSDEKKSIEEVLENAIIKGREDETKRCVRALLESREATDIINSCMIPSLTKVGELFEQNKIFLPNLLISSKAASAGFDEIKEFISSQGGKRDVKGKVVLATVKGDIHDIGKNIVKTVMENFGFEIIDLGKDVDKSTVLEAAKSDDVRLVGLSALMTTTVPAMEETIELLHRETNVKVMVGGAVLTDESAREIGADFYAKDAMASVRIADKIYE